MLRLILMSGALFLFPPSPCLTRQQPPIKKPWRVFRAAGLSASIFQNVIKTPEGTRTYPKVSLVKTYREGDEFKSMSSLGRDDLPVAALLLQQAWTAIIAEDSNGGGK